LHHYALAPLRPFIITPLCRYPLVPLCPWSIAPSRNYALRPLRSCTITPSHRYALSDTHLSDTHSLPQSEIQPSKLVWPLLSQVSSVPSDICTGWFQRFDCFASPANSPPPRICRKARSPARCAIAKFMVNTTPNQVRYYSAFISFHRIHVVVNLSFPFMAPVARVTHSSIHATLSATIRDSAV